MFPVVNENDEIISSIYSKKELHDKNYKHRAVHIFVETFGRGFILQLKGKNSENAGKWSSAVSGHVECRESYEEAAIREAKEELGLEIDKKELIRIIKIAACKETNNEFVVLFTYLMDRNTESIKLDLNEVENEEENEVENVLIVPLTDVIRDVNKNLSDYSPAFIKLLDEWLDHELLEKAKGGENV